MPEHQGKGLGDSPKVSNHHHKKGSELLLFDGVMDLEKGSCGYKCYACRYKRNLDRRSAVAQKGRRDDSY